MEFECRTCLKVSANVRNIFSNDLPHKIETISSVEVPEDGRFPSKICEECVRHVTQMYEFRKVIRTSNVILMRRCMKEEAVTVTETTQDEETNFELKEEGIFDDFKIENEDDEEEEEDEIDEAPGLGREKYKIFKCVRCEFTSPEYDLWKCHQKKHKKAKQAICSICGKTVLSYNLKKHYLTHTESPVKCLVCDKVCKHEESLRSHMFTHKNGPYLCTICGKVYRHRQGYNVHKKRHATGDAKTVECSTCGKLFFDKKTLVRHIYSHTGERPFPCKYCEKGFTSSYARNTHERLHTKEKPFSCDFCEAAFPQRVSLRTHLKSKHSDKIIVNKNEMAK